MRAALQVAVVALGVGLVATVRPALPDDVGTWAPFALSGDVVLALGGDRDGVLVGTARGLHHLSPDGTRRDLPVPGPVRALAPHPGGTFVGTAEGLLDLPPAAGRQPAPVPDPVLTGVDVSAVDSTDDAVVVGASTGLLRRTEDGGWERLWPPAQEPPQAVDAVLAVRDGILFAHPDGLALRTEDGDVRLVRSDVAVVSLHDDPVAGLVWAGLRGGPLLLVSADEGRTWRSSADGLGLSAVETLVRVPAEEGPGDLVVGGSGLADGTGNAGTQRSTDGGRSWQARQDRLSNTHVYALLARPEPWRVEVSVLGTGADASVPLPGREPRLYAGTNGGGVSSQRPAAPLLTTLASATPVLRVLEPLLLGALLLLCLLPAYRHLWRNAAASPRPPPADRRPVPRSRVDPSTDDPSHPKENQ